MQKILQIFFLQILFFHLLYGAQIGVDYHAYTADFKNSVFLPIYQQPKVRSKVKSELINMKQKGVDSILAHIFIGSPQYIKKNSKKKHKFLITFPPTLQELNNINNFIADVKDANLTLDLGFLWLGQADFNVGCIDPKDDGKDPHNIKNCTYPNLGYGKLTPSKFLDNVKKTIISILSLPNITYVRTFYFDGEVLYNPDPNKLPIGKYRKNRRNEDWFFKKNYPIFASKALEKNINPSIYFLPAEPNSNRYNDGILNAKWNALPSKYPSIKGHRSMYLPLRSLLYIRQVFKKYKWPKEWMPKEYATSFYLDGNTTSQKIKWIHKYLEDIQYVLDKNNFHFSGIIAAETGNSRDCKEQETINKVLQETDLKSVIYWTTPYRGKRKQLGNDETSYILDSKCNFLDSHPHHKRIPNK